MIITASVYRSLVLISLGANLLWTFFRDFYWEYFDENTRILLEADGFGSVIPGTEYLFWIIMTASIVCYVGLFFFQRWAVWLLLSLDIIVLMFLAPFGGIEISAPIERITKTIFLMTDGAIIALALFSNIEEIGAEKGSISGQIP